MGKKSGRPIPLLLLFIRYHIHETKDDSLINGLVLRKPPLIKGGKILVLYASINQELGLQIYLKVNSVVIEQTKVSVNLIKLNQ